MHTTYDVVRWNVWFHQHQKVVSLFQSDQKQNILISSFLLVSNVWHKQFPGGQGSATGPTSTIRTENTCRELFTPGTEINMTDQDCKPRWAKFEVTYGWSVKTTEAQQNWIIDDWMNIVYYTISLWIWLMTAQITCLILN